MIGRETFSGHSFYTGLLEALTEVMGSAQGYLSHHAPRVCHLARQMGIRMGLGERELADLIFAAILADVGMIGLVEEAWENPRPVLDPDTRARVRGHPLRSEEIVLAAPHLENVAPLVRHHHEWWNGTGYPDGLRGEEIPRGARILRLADSVCAMGEFRPQRRALSPEAIRGSVEGSAGTEFSPDVARVFLSMLDAGEVAEFHHRVYQRAARHAAARLIPAEVSPLSSEQLLDILAGVIDAKDPYTAGHSRRVAILSVAVADQLRMSEELRATVWAAGYLHDLGKLSVPLKVLTKQGRLDEAERHRVQEHVSVGAGVLEEIPSLQHLTTGARYHHERWDGSGYPEGLAGEHIPLVARILAVADAYDAMTSGRAYRPSRSHAEAMGEIARAAGSHFGPRVAGSFLSLPDHLFHSISRPQSRADPPFRDGLPRWSARTAAAEAGQSGRRGR